MVAAGCMTEDERSGRFSEFRIRNYKLVKISNPKIKKRFRESPNCSKTEKSKILNGVLIG